MRPWTYQTCNEFGYYQTTDSPNQPFYSWKALSLSFYDSLCYSAFGGWTAKPQTSWMNVLYGGMDITALNTVFPSGSIDPWHALGVTEATATMSEPSLTPLFIVGTSHCADLYQPRSYDPATLTAAREVIADQVDLWLSAESTDDAAVQSTDDDEFISESSAVALIVIVCILAVALVVGAIAVYLLFIRPSKSAGLNAPLAPRSSNKV